MIRKRPGKALQGLPCSIVAVMSATGGNAVGEPVMTQDGYTSLKDANRFIRSNLKIKKRIDFRRGSRPKLKDLHLDGRAVVCVYGHYLYLDHETYYSFFRNEDDDVVTVWILGGAE